MKLIGCKLQVFYRPLLWYVNLVVGIWRRKAILQTYRYAGYIQHLYFYTNTLNDSVLRSGAQ